MTALPTHQPGFEPMPLAEMHNLRKLSTPFPTTIPPGVTLVSFESFETSSAIIFVDESDERVDPDKDSEELDGMGIVVTLLPTHAKPDAHGITGRRKKKRKAQAVLSGSARRPWWDVWEDHESVRRKLYDS